MTARCPRAKWPRRSQNTASTRRRPRRGRSDAANGVVRRCQPAFEVAMSTIEVKVPDIGDFTDVPVIEVLVKPGDTVKAEDSLVTLESDKATMDVPAPAAGVIKSLGVKVGDKVSEGHLILTLEEAAGAAAPAQAAPASKAAQPAAPARAPAAPAPAAPPTKPPTAAPAAPIAPAPPMHATAPSAPIDDAAFRKAHASPSVRAHARALGVDLSQIQGSGPAGRILQEDVENYVKQVMSGAKVAGAVAGAGGAALGLLPWPQVDFAKFGPIETKPLSRIKKIAGANLHRNWVLIPHVTNHDDADIT